VQRKYPTVVPAGNPWVGVERIGQKATKPAATREEAYAPAAALKAIGEPHLGLPTFLQELFSRWRLTPSLVGVGASLAVDRRLVVEGKWLFMAAMRAERLITRGQSRGLDA
jgi:hypothetical protein